MYEIEESAPAGLALVYMKHLHKMTKSCLKLHLIRLDFHLSRHQRMEVISKPITESGRISAAIKDKRQWHWVQDVTRERQGWELEMEKLGGGLVCSGGPPCGQKGHFPTNIASHSSRFPTRLPRLR
jgi:hypothetical protein